MTFRSPARVSPPQPRLRRTRTARQTAVQHPRPQLNPLPRCRPRLFPKPPPDLTCWRCPSPRRNPVKTPAVANCCQLLMTTTSLPPTACLVSPRPRAPRPRAPPPAPPPPDGPPRLCHLKRPAIRARARTRAACRPFSTTTWTIFSRERSRRRKKRRNTRPFWTKTTRTRTFLDLAAVRPPRPQVVKKLVVTSPSRTSSRYLMYFYYPLYFIGFFIIFYFIFYLFFYSLSLIGCYIFMFSGWCSPGA